MDQATEKKEYEKGGATVAGQGLAYVKQDRTYLAVKRTFDVVVSLLALVILSPLLLLTGLVIYLDDPKGSPIFTQTRVGKGGKEFKFYKFRSMVVNAEELLDELIKYNEVEGCAFKIEHDPRITRVGRFIRKTSIDELPQLVNVLKGDMSIVGPRPPLPREVEHYSDYQMQRLAVTPGLTCYWQTAHHRNDIDFDGRVVLDLKYIQERSTWLDLKLICRTFTVIFSKQGW